ncbi:hypothetical protein TanjilG_15653 [Lupinus angustifolius]|uniref:DUF4005 domain-containing protein n=1 Tax=Lupinus angustifolius TaxID=3871 RepID=A0A1J7HWG0_LUPAN|nr:PREDICTED: protein IQ-DOMAIN 14-like [Lupinus angustifolius]OIW17070.1 hypothetical protein TanjilG_15653 [Lupinus angustifolius]
MAKKRSWFSLVKRLFIWDTHSTLEKKEKRRKWIFGKVKTKTLPSIKAPQLTKETRQSEVKEERSKQGLTVAIGSAATAANVAVEVVRLHSVYQCKEKQEEFHQPINTRHGAPQFTYQCQWEIEEFSAIIIQTAFRGYLARKALKALKGIVKLQALIRGRAVRRQAMSTLKCLQSIVSIQSQFCASRVQMVEGRWNCDANEEKEGSKVKIIRMDSYNEKRWDDSILLKEKLDASCIIKKEAVLKRQKIKEYSFNHRRSAESERSKVNGRWRYWMEQWVDTQLSKSKELEDLDSVFSSQTRAKQLKLRNIERQNQVEGLDSPSCSTIPTYMAATKSAQAKVRSTSSPRARTGGNMDMNSDSYSPCKKKLSIATSIKSEVLSSGKMSKFSSIQERSPSLKALSRPIKSSQTMKDLNISSY